MYEGFHMHKERIKHKYKPNELHIVFILLLSHSQFNYLPQYTNTFYRVEVEIDPLVLRHSKHIFARENAAPGWF